MVHGHLAGQAESQTVAKSVEAIPYNAPAQIRTVGQGVNSRPTLNSDDQSMKELLRVLANLQDKFSTNQNKAESRHMGTHNSCKDPKETRCKARKPSRLNFPKHRSSEGSVITGTDTRSFSPEHVSSRISRIQNTSTISKKR